MFRRLICTQFYRLFQLGPSACGSATVWSELFLNHSALQDLFVLHFSQCDTSARYIRDNISIYFAVTMKNFAHFFSLPCAVKVSFPLFSLPLLYLQQSQFVHVQNTDVPPAFLTCVYNMSRRIAVYKSVFVKYSSNELYKNECTRPKERIHEAVSVKPVELVGADSAAVWRWRS